MFGFAHASSTIVATPNPYPVSNSIIDVGQTSTASTTLSGGSSPYTANWIWIPPSSSNMPMGNTLIASLPVSTNALALTVNAVSPTSLKLTFDNIVYYVNATGTNKIYGTWTFNAIVSDGSGDASPVPELTNTIVIGPALVAGKISPSALSILGVVPGPYWPKEVAFSANGLFAYVGVQAGSMYTIDTATNAISNTITGLTSPWNIALAPNGNTIYIASDPNIKYINVNTHVIEGTIPISTFPQPFYDQGFYSVAPSHSGNLIYVADNLNNSIDVFAASTNSLETIIPWPGGPAGLAMSPSGNTMYVANTNNTISVFDTQSGKVTNTITSTPSFDFSWWINTGLAVSPDGNYLYVTDPGAGYIDTIDLADGQVTARLPDSNTPSSIAVSPQGNTLYAVNSGFLAGNNTVSVVNIASNEIIGTLSSPKFTMLWSVAISNDGNTLYLSNGPYQNPQGSVYTFNVSANSIIGTINFTGVPVSLALSYNGSKLYVLNQLNSTVSTFNTSTNRKISSTEQEFIFDDLYNFAISPDGKHLYLAQPYVESVDMLNTTTDGIERVYSGFVSPEGLAISPDGKTLYVSNPQANTVNVFNTTSGTITSTITSSLFNSPNGLSVSPDGKTLYVANNEGSTITVLNTSNGTVTGTIDGFSYPWGVTVAPDGLYAYVSESAGNLIKVNLASPTVRGNTTTLTANPSGGTSPYLYQWYYGPSDNCSDSVPIEGATSSTYNAFIGNAYYCYLLSDSSSTGNPTFSAPNFVDAIVPHNASVSMVLTAGANTQLSLNVSSVKLYVSSSNSITANVLFANVTTSYSTLPDVSGKSFSKTAVFNVSISANTATSLSINMTVGYGCGANPEPYELIGNTWTALSYATNTVSCTVTFSIPSDPIVGLFNATSVQTVTQGGSGAPRPTISASIKVPPSTYATKYGCIVRNLTVSSLVECTFNGRTFRIGQDYVSQNVSGTEVNGNGYVLTIGKAVSIGNLSNYTYSIELIAINSTNYLVGAPTAEIELSAQPQHPPPSTTVTTTSVPPTTTERQTPQSPPTTTQQPTTQSNTSSSSAQGMGAYQYAAIAAAVTGSAAAITYVLLRFRRR